MLTCKDDSWRILRDENTLFNYEGVENFTLSPHKVYVMITFSNLFIIQVWTEMYIMMMMKYKTIN